MTTDSYINDNKTETFKKGESVIMHNCFEAYLTKNENKIWICQTDSFLSKAKEDVVFLKDFSNGYFSTQFLKKSKI